MYLMQQETGYEYDQRDNGNDRECRRRGTRARDELSRHREIRTQSVATDKGVSKGHESGESDERGSQDVAPPILRPFRPATVPDVPRDAFVPADRFRHAVRCSARISARRTTPLQERGTACVDEVADVHAGRHLRVRKRRLLERIVSVRRVRRVEQSRERRRQVERSERRCAGRGREVAHEGIRILLRDRPGRETRGGLEGRRVRRDKACDIRRRIGAPRDRGRTDPVAVRSVTVCTRRDDRVLSKPGRVARKGRQGASERRERRRYRVVEVVDEVGDCKRERRRDRVCDLWTKVEIVEEST